VFADPDARIAATAWDAVTREASERIADPAFGLLAGRCWHPSNLGALGYAWLSSSTLRTALGRLVRYWRLLGEASTGHLVDSPAGLTFVVERQSDDPVTNAVVVDFVMSLVVSMCRMNAGAGLRPVTIRLRRDDPEDRTSYERFFGCSVCFASGEDSVTLSRADADRQLPTSNREIAANMDRILAERLVRIDKDNVVARCQAHLLEQLASGAVTEEMVAKELHMSRRTLQRKLADADVTYKQLVDDTRRDLAMRYLDDAGYSITDVTFLLGFSQQSAFTRAFRRWAGISPSEYRARRRVPA
jgi:AraC-like DNA-binding protein